MGSLTLVLFFLDWSAPHENLEEVGTYFDVTCKVRLLMLSMPINHIVVDKQQVDPYTLG